MERARVKYAASTKLLRLTIYLNVTFVQNEEEKPYSVGISFRVICLIFM